MDINAVSLNGSIDLMTFINDIYANDKYLTSPTSTSDKKSPIPYINKQLFRNFNPDITGFTLCLFISPPFEGIINKDSTYIENVQKLFAFAVNDFTPPQRQIESERVDSRTGGIPFATELIPTQQCSVTFNDNMELDIFNYHNNWVTYMHELVDGFIEPPAKYYADIFSPDFGCLDYAGSFFFVKYEPNFKDIKFVGKATGVFPQSLPNKEALGTKTQNDIILLPFTYNCAYYEETLDDTHIIWKELETLITTQYS